MSRILWGIFFILIGIIIGTNSFGLTNINIFFDGWWTFFIIVPCFIGLFNKKESKLGNLIGVMIGFALLLVARGILNFEIVAKMFLPAVFVVIGLFLMSGNFIKQKISKKIKEGKSKGLETIVATFSEQKICKEDESFDGASLDAVFGSIILDLRKAKIEKEAIISVSTIFGGVEILVPNDTNVKVKATPIFGGVSNRVSKKENHEKTIYIEAFCLFGGTDIK